MVIYKLEKELEESKSIAIEAGEIILQIYAKEFEIDYKEDESPVTEADQKANDKIVNHLERLFPQYGILAEESKDDINRREKEWCFIIDPLDGTKEFIKRNGEFTVNIALAHKGKSVLGVVYIPVTKELYYGVKGQGAYYEKKGVSERLKVSKETENILAFISRSHDAYQVKALLKKNNITKIKAVGSSIKGCLVARGQGEIYYRFGYTSEWDTAAMQIIVEEAGGIFRQMDDSPMTYNRENTLNEKGFYILNNIKNKLDMGE